jgi:hypothetical protein
MPHAPEPTKENPVTFLLSVILTFAVLMFSTKWAADHLEAQRTDYKWCALSIIVASVVWTIGRSLPAGWLVAMILSALTYKLVLVTTLWKGFCIVILQAILSALILFGLGAVLATFL